MWRLVYLAALAAAAPDTDTQLKRATALARWADRTGPAPPSWTVTSPKDVTVGQEVHAGKIKKVSRATVELGGSSAVVKTIEQQEGGGTLLMELLFLHASGGGTLYLEMLYLEVLRGAPGVPRLYGAWRDGKHVTYVVGDCGDPQCINQVVATRLTPSHPTHLLICAQAILSEKARPSTGPRRPCCRTRSDDLPRRSRSNWRGPC